MEVGDAQRVDIVIDPGEDQKVGVGTTPKVEKINLALEEDLEVAEEIDKDLEVAIVVAREVKRRDEIRQNLGKDRNDHIQEPEVMMPTKQVSHTNLRTYLFMQNTRMTTATFAT